MDTVRADHLSCYGYDRKTTTNIDKIAEQGVLFENAFAAAPWTPPSHASIFTGLYPSRHKTLGREIFLNENISSLPAILSQNGYLTIGLTCCPLLGKGSGFEKSFREYYKVTSSFDFSLKNLTDIPKKILSKDFVRSSVYGPDKGAYHANEIIKSLLRREHIEKNRKNPFFLFVNYFESHTPYDPPRPFKEKFCIGFNESDIYLKEFLFKRIFGKTTEKITDLDLSIHKLHSIASGEGGFNYVIKELDITDKDWNTVKSWYDGEIAYLDFRIGELMDFLSNERLLDETLLVITSDHGENFGDHGLAVHPLCVYDTILHVPLIINCPFVTPIGRKLPNIVSTIDILPTILDIVGIDSVGEVQGKSLYPFNSRKFHDFVCAEYGGLHMRSMRCDPSSRISAQKIDKVDQGRKCIRDRTYKYILSSKTEELYNIQDDPSESENIVSECPEVRSLLRKKLEETVEIDYYGPPQFPNKKGTKDMLNRLEALGYI